MTIINKITKKWIEAYTNKPYVTCIIEHNGDLVGSRHVIELITTKLEIPKSNVYYPIDTENTSIKIEHVRAIRKTLSLKTSTLSAVTRLVVIQQADTLTSDAQNALLKLLEELPHNTAVLLLADNRNNLLSTIVSRSFIIPLLPIELTEALKYAHKFDISNNEAMKYYVMSDGNFTNFDKMLREKSLETTELIQKAKEYFHAPVIRRMQLNESIVSSKEVLLPFIQNLELIAKSGMHYAKNIKDTTQWKNNLKIIIESKTQLHANVSAKLILLKLSVKLR